MIQAIETKYQGYRFRSRLEARWAVFFDAMQIDWRYEVEGFKIVYHNREPIFYLPDFFLPDIKTFVEVKPFYPPEGEDIRKIMGAAGHGDLDILLLCGSDVATYNGALFLGSEKGPGYDFGLIDRLQFSTCPLCNTAGLYHVPKIDGPSVFRCFNITCQGHEHLGIKREVNWITPQIEAAVETARSARFEHGETPRVQRGRQSTKV